MLEPNHHFEYSALILDTAQARDFLPHKKRQTLRSHTHSSPNSWFLYENSGADGSLHFQAVYFAQFCSRPLQHHIILSWNKSVQALNRLVCLVSTFRLSLAWWLWKSALKLEKSFLPISWKILMMDTTLLGWGVALNTLWVEGICN